MLCDDCKEREATRHESARASDGTWTEVHLCDPCALAKGGIDLKIQTPATILQAMLQGVVSGTARPKKPKKACPHCGLGYDEFRARGRLGCPHDYEVFEDELLPLLEQIHHRGTRHVGKSPASAEGRSERETELIELRRVLAEAVQREQYEEAARLRDRIRALETELLAGEDANDAAGDADDGVVDETGSDASDGSEEE